MMNELWNEVILHRSCNIVFVLFRYRVELRLLGIHQMDGKLQAYLVLIQYSIIMSLRDQSKGFPDFFPTRSVSRNSL
jgi:hypothetical protein